MQVNFAQDSPYESSPEFDAALTPDSRCGTRATYQHTVWTHQRDAELIALYTADHQPTLAGIAAVMGLRASQVRGRVGNLIAAGLLQLRIPRWRARPPATTESDDGPSLALLANYASAAWPAEKLRQLILGWRAGDTATAIGDRLHVTKNAVVGRAHRLIDAGFLVNRPSPLLAALIPDSELSRRALAQRRRNARGKAPVPSATLPALPSESSDSPARTSRPAGAVRKVVVVPSRGVATGPNPAPAEVWVTADYDSGHAIAPLVAPTPVQAPVVIPLPVAPIRTVAESDLPLISCAAPRYRHECSWPIGHPGREGFHFCAEAIEQSERNAGRVYCPSHHKMGHSKWAWGVTA